MIEMGVQFAIKRIDKRIEEWELEVEQVIKIGDSDRRSYALGIIHGLKMAKSEMKASAEEPSVWM